MERITEYKFSISPNIFDYVVLPSVFQRGFYTREAMDNLKTLWHSPKYRLIRKLLVRRKFPGYLTPYGGQFWMALPVETLFQILVFLAEHPDYLEYHRYTLIPDEIFFLSIIQSLFKNPGKANLIEPSVTYADWEDKDSPSPRIFTAADLSMLKGLPEHVLFARKFDMDQDSQILDLIDTKILGNMKSEVGDRQAKSKIQYL
jgi:hypothetical protein